MVQPTCRPTYQLTLFPLGYVISGAVLMTSSERNHGTSLISSVMGHNNMSYEVIGTQQSCESGVAYSSLHETCFICS